MKAHTEDTTDSRIKYYIVTKAQLIELQRLSCLWSADRTLERFQAMDAAQLACMKIELPEWATYEIDCVNGSLE